MNKNAWSFIAVVAAMGVELMGGRAEAATYTWTNTTSGASGYWTNSANWVGGTYPANGDTAYMTNAIASGAYTNILDTTLSGTLTALTISNSSAGQAWLYVTNAALNVTTFTLSSGGVLEVANNGVVTNKCNNTDLVNWWLGNTGTINIDNGGKFVTTKYITIGNGQSSPTHNVNATVSTRSASGTGIWDLSGQSLIVGFYNATGNVLRIDGNGVAGGVIVTNGANLNVGWVSTAINNTLIITNGGKVFVGTANDTHVGQAGRNNQIIVDGGTLSAGNCCVGDGGNSNTLTVANGGYVSAPQLAVGLYYTGVSGASGSTVTVAGTNSSGAKATINLTSGAFQIGNAASANTNWVTIGNGGIITNAQAVTVGGTGGVGNGLSITNGGQMFSGIAAANIGNGGNNNTVLVMGGSGGTALWNLGGQALTVGNGGATGNVLNVGASGMVTNLTALTVKANNSLTLGAGGQIYASAATNAGTLRVSLDDAVTPACGRLSVAGNLNVTGATLNIVTNGAPVASSYVIASYGSLTGAFAATNGLPAGYTVNTNYNSLNQIALVASLPTITLVTPTNNQSFGFGVSVSASATVANGTSPYAVTFYTNCGSGFGPAGATNAAPYAVNLGVLPPGSYSIYATVTDAVSKVAISATNAFTVLGVCQTPTFSPPAGGYVGAQSITITTLTANSTVFYTTDGSTPTNTSPSGPAGSSYATVSVPVPASMTLKAYATNAATADSAVATAVYGTVVTPAWTNTAGGSWPVAGNWTNGVVATGADVTADFGALSLPGDVTVTLDGARTIGHLRFDDQNATKHAWTLNTGSGGPLTLQVSSGTPVISNNVATTIGAALAGTNGLFKAGSGTLTNAGDNTLTGLFGAQAGTVAATVNWVGNGRNGQQAQVGGYGAAALWTNTLGFVLGNGAAVSNTFMVASQGVLRVNGGVTVGASAATFNSMVLTNGGQASSTAASTIGNAANNNSAVVIGGGSGGPTSLWNLGAQSLTVGNGSAAGNVLRIDGAGVAGGAVVTNLGTADAVLGIILGGSGNSVVLTNGAKVFSSGHNYLGGTSLGNGVAGNTLTVVGGAADSVFYGNAQYVLVGSAQANPSTIYGNRLVVGAGGMMTNVGYYGGIELDFAVGWAQQANATAYSNQMVVTDGGRVSTRGNLSVGLIYGSSAGGVASSNSLLIANGGWVSIPGAFCLGADSTVAANSGTACFNGLTITNGGQFVTGADSYIGRAFRAGSVAHNNTAWIGGSLGGTNALWNLGGKNLYIGNATSGTATGNVLTVSAGGMVTNVNTLTVAATNALTLAAGGQVYASAATVAGALTVGIDDAATPACGRLTTSNALNISGATLNIVTNGSPTGTVYVIASYGVRNGTFATTNGLPYGWVLNMDYNSGKAIALVPPAAPTLASLSPTNNATGVLISSPLVATFSDNISLVSGGVITITNLTAGTASDIVMPSAQVTTNGAVLTITPAASLAYSSTYAVLIGTNTIRDALGLLAFAGITNTTTWRFNTQAPVITLGIANLAASGATATSVTFNATLQAPGTNADVWVYWGPTDGTNNPAAWSNSAPVGSWTSVDVTNISFATNSLASDTRYYYTFLATNAATNVWASPSESVVTLRKASAVARYWDGGTADIAGDGNGASDGGAGNWHTTVQNWDAGGVPHAAWNNAYNDTAIFGGAAGGAVSLLGNVTVGGLRFDTAGYTISGANTLTFGAAGSLAVNADATIASAIGGSVAVAKTGTGTLTNSGDNTLTGLFGAQAGTVAATVNWVGNGRSGQQAQVGGYGSAALWTNTLGFVLGNGAAVSNTFTVASQGVLRVNGAITVGANAATYSTLVLTNGGQAFSTAGSTIGNNAANNAALVMGGGSGGPTSLWNLGAQSLTVGNGTATGNMLKIDGNGIAGGAAVTNGGNVVFGGNGNSVVLTNGAQFLGANSGLQMFNSNSNTLSIAGGSAHSTYSCGSNYFLVGQAFTANASHNQLVVGVGGMLTNAGYFAGYREFDFVVGAAEQSGVFAIGNQMVVNGGTVSTLGNLAVGLVYPINSSGGTAASNSLLIANGGGVNIPGAFYLGSDANQYTGYGTASYNSLTITNGGQFVTGADSYIGRAFRAGSVANNNTAWIGGSLGGTNALWNLGGRNLAIGNATSGTATGNVLTVSAGGMVTNVNTLTVAATNALTLAAGGQVYAGAATVAGALTAGIDDAATPACGRVSVAGNLNITGATLTFDVSGAPAQIVYVIASYDSLTGTFAATSGLPPDGSIVYDFGGAKQVALVVQARGTVFRFR